MCKGKKHTQQGKLAHVCLCHCDCPELCATLPKLSSRPLLGPSLYFSHGLSHLCSREKGVMPMLTKTALTRCDSEVRTPGLPPRLP